MRTLLDFVRLIGLADLGASLIRTAVPVGVGAALTWISVVLGVIAPPAGLAPWVTAVAIAGYYALLRLAERRWPKLGWLLGLPKPPTYGS